MSGRIHRGTSTALADFEMNNMMTVYNGEKMTVAQAKAKKAAAKRKANAEAKKQNSEWTRENVLPDVKKEITATRKSTKCLKTILAFVDNGPVQWPGDYKKLMKMFPDVDNKFNLYHIQYHKILGLEAEMDKMLKRSKTNKNFFSIAQEFGYKMFDLLDLVSEISDVISKNHVCDAPGFKDREIIIGAADGRRKGLKHILSNTYSNINVTKKNLINLAKVLNEAYEDVVRYTADGRAY